jgi:hypothetical protein
MPFVKYGAVLVRNEWFRCCFWRNERELGPIVVAYCNDYTAAEWIIIERELGPITMWDECYAPRRQRHGRRRRRRRGCQ